MAGSGINRRDILTMAGIASVGASVIPATEAGSGQPASISAGVRSATAKQATGRQPNIVLFVPDEMRADALACYGNPVTKTPHFDRLASEGTRFENCHVQFPVCGASRCSFLTGWPAHVRGHRSLFHYLRPEEPNLFRYLKNAGYDVVWLGKNDALAQQSFYSSVTRWSPGRGPADEAAGKPRPVTPGIMSMLYSPLGDRRESNDYFLIQSAIKELERERDRPVCIFLAMAEPHPPYTAPADFRGMYNPDSLPPPISPGGTRRPNYHKAIREAYGLTRLSDADFREVRAVYYGQVSYSDWMLGELMEAMERIGRNKDTALIAFSDHGDYAGDYGLIEKWPSGLEDCLTHVPLIVRMPGGVPGRVSKEMTEVFDIMQTCLELAGTEANHTHFSRSLIPQLHGEKGDPTRAAFTEGGYNVYEPQTYEPIVPGAYEPKTRLQNEHPETIVRAASVRTRTHKLIERPAGQSELYDCVRDPQLRVNLFGQVSASAVQSALQTKLLHWYIDTSGIAPMDKDPRGLPPFYPTPSFAVDPRTELDH